MRRMIYSLAVGTMMCATSVVSAQTAAKLTWGPAPAPFPAGAQMAVVKGNPMRPEMFTVQFQFPNGYVVPPHWHPTDENAVVKSGKFWIGMGDKVDPKGMKMMKAGDKGTIPAKEHHYAKAEGKTEVEISAMGPFAMTLVGDARIATKKKH